MNKYYKIKKIYNNNKNNNHSNNKSKKKKKNANMMNLSMFLMAKVIKEN